MTFLAESKPGMSGASADAKVEARREPLNAHGGLSGPRPPLYSRIRFQLPVGLALAIGVPYAAALVLSQPAGEAWIETATGATAAVTSGYYALRKLSTLPTMREIGSVALVFAATYFLVWSFLLVSGAEYLPLGLTAAFLSTIVWFTGVLIASRRARRLRFLLAPVGQTRSVMGLKGAIWEVVDSTDVQIGPCDGVVVDLSAEIPPRWQTFLTSCALAGIPVYHYKALREAFTGRLEIDHLSENMLGSYNPLNGYRTVKRVVDFVTAAAAAVLLSPLLIGVAIAVRIDSPGSALFRQERVARGGKTFTIYKFRTMRAGAARPGSRQDAITVDGDPRITRIGGFLRASRIDELPQIFNILKGEMSWIGPRPEAVPLAAWYQEQLPFYQYRHMVQPGISGWAQVNQGHVTDLEQVLGKLHYDFYYIKNLSIWLDILIVLKTFRIMLTGMGAR